MEDKVNGMIGLFLVLVIGVLFVQILGDQTASTTQYTSTRDTITWDKGTNATLTNPWTVFVNVTNSTGGLVTATNYTTFTNRSVVYMADNTSACIDGNSCYVYYQYAGANYVADSTSRSLLNLITLFMAFAVLAYSVYLGYQKYIKDML